jgi:cell division protein FtsQ
MVPAPPLPEQPMLRRPATAIPTPLPADVRLLQTGAQWLGPLALLVLLALLLTWALRHPVFTLRGIRIEGDLQRVNPHAIKAQVASRLQGNFVTLDLQHTRRVFEAVPWVRRATVRKVWPMRLVVRLEEHRVAALWGAEQGGDRMVNVQGEVFEANLGDVEDDSLPRLIGPEGSAAQMLAAARKLAPVLDPLGSGTLETLQLSPRGSWRVQLDKGVTIELGRGTDDELLARTQRFVGTMARVVATYQRPLESADLRHNGGFAVRLKGITTQPAVVPPPRRRTG